MCQPISGRVTNRLLHSRFDSIAPNFFTTLPLQRGTQKQTVYYTHASTALHQTFLLYSPSSKGDSKTNRLLHSRFDNIAPNFFATLPLSKGDSKTNRLLHSRFDNIAPNFFATLPLRRGMFFISVHNKI